MNKPVSKKPVDRKKSDRFFAFHTTSRKKIVSSYAAIGCIPFIFYRPGGKLYRVNGLSMGVVK